MSATCISCQPLPRPEIRRIWKEYQLEPRTRFNTRVTSVKRKPGTGEHIKDDPAHSQSKWIINSGEDGEFDAVVVTVGTCGQPMRIKFPGMPQPQRDEDSSEPGSEKHEGDDEEVFQGKVLHSSELDDAELGGKNVIVIGSGASGVEAVETALEQGAKHCVMLARDDKVSICACFPSALLTTMHTQWIIPRNIVLDTLIAAQPFGREMPLSVVWEKVVAAWNYRGAPELVPARLGLFESTPVVNDVFVGQVKEGRCEYVRCDIQRLTRDGVRVKVRGREDGPGEGREEREVRFGWDPRAGGV